MNKINSATANRRKSTGICFHSIILLLQFIGGCLFFNLFFSLIVSDASKAKSEKSEKTERTKKDYPEHPMERRSQSDTDMKSAKKTSKNKTK